MINWKLSWILTHFGSFSTLKNHQKCHKNEEIHTHLTFKGYCRSVTKIQLIFSMHKCCDDKKARASNRSFRWNAQAASGKLSARNSHRATISWEFDQLERTPWNHLHRPVRFAKKNFTFIMHSGTFREKNLGSLFFMLSEKYLWN